MAHDGEELGPGRGEERLRVRRGRRAAGGLGRRGRAAAVLVEMALDACICVAVGGLVGAAIGLLLPHSVGGLTAPMRAAASVASFESF